MKSGTRHASKSYVLADISRKADAAQRDCDRTPEIAGVWGILHSAVSFALPSATPDFPHWDTSILREFPTYKPRVVDWVQCDTLGIFLTQYLWLPSKIPAVLPLPLPSPSMT